MLCNEKKMHFRPETRDIRTKIMGKSVNHWSTTTNCGGGDVMILQRNFLMHSLSLTLLL